ncbi:MAG TPA: hypothetical protein VFE31_06570, partial [Opitutaceae bacterium]|nr:hypothetical protein [Opitutaceae bacterium]
MRFPSHVFSIGAALISLAAPLAAQSPSTGDPTVVLDRSGATVVLEPYAPNILRVTLSKLKDSALAGPGFGFVAAPNHAGWRRSDTSDAITYRSGRMAVTIRTGPSRGGPAPLPTERDIARFFNGSAPGVGMNFSAPGQGEFLALEGWSMAVPNYKDGTA